MGYRVVVRSTLDEDQLPRGSFLSGLAKGVTHFVGGVASGIVGGVRGFVTGGPIGALTGGIKGVVAYDQAHGVPVPFAFGGNPPAVSTAGPLAPMPGWGGGSTWGGGGVPITSPGGGVTTNPWTGKPMVGPGTMNGGRPKGTHLNKSWTYSRKTGQLAAPGTKLVANRRMNWGNSRALSRAERRIGAAVRHFSKYIRWVHPNRPGHAAPKFRRKK